MPGESAGGSYQGPTEEERVAAERALIENDGGAYCPAPPTATERDVVPNAHPQG